MGTYDARHARWTGRAEFENLLCSLFELLRRGLIKTRLFVAFDPALCPHQSILAGRRGFETHHARFSLLPSGANGVARDMSMSIMFDILFEHLPVVSVTQDAAIVVYPWHPSRGGAHRFDP